MDFKIERFNAYDDKRGRIVVFLRNRDLGKKVKKFGQIYFVTFERKGIVRGNHYHKKIREWFGIVNGKVKVVLVDINTNERKEMILNANSKKYLRLEIGPNIAHGFKSLSESVSLLNYTDKEWEATDVYPAEIIKQKK